MNFSSRAIINFIKNTGIEAGLALIADTLVDDLVGKLLVLSANDNGSIDALCEGVMKIMLEIRESQLTDSILAYIIQSLLSSCSYSLLSSNTLFWLASCCSTLFSNRLCKPLVLWKKYHLGKIFSW
jgi:hypothetical protein